MSGYRPPRFSGLGAHVSGVSAWILVDMLERAKALDRIQQIPDPARREEVLWTYDSLRAAGIYWNEQLRERMPVTIAAPLEGAAQKSPEPAAREVTAAEAAKLIDCTDRRIRQLINEGRLTGRLVRNRWLIDAASVEDYRLTKDVA